jgi:hypothetical protein
MKLFAFRWKYGDSFSFRRIVIREPMLKSIKRALGLAPAEVARC